MGPWTVQQRRWAGCWDLFRGERAKSMLNLKFAQTFHSSWSEKAIRSPQILISSANSKPRGHLERIMYTTHCAAGPVVVKYSDNVITYSNMAKAIDKAYLTFVKHSMDANAQQKLDAMSRGDPRERTNPRPYAVFFSKITGECLTYCNGEKCNDAIEVDKCSCGSTERPARCHFNNSVCHMCSKSISQCICVKGEPACTFITCSKCAQMWEKGTQMYVCSVHGSY